MARPIMLASASGVLKTRSAPYFRSISSRRARICAAGGIRYRLGAAVGSRLLAAHALHLACALPGIDYACELGEFDRLLDDPFAGIEIEGGALALPEGPGSGVRPVARK